MTGYIYGIRHLTTKDGNNTNALLVTLMFKNKNTNVWETKNVVVFSSNEYKVGDEVKVSKAKSGNYFIPNQK